MFAATSKLNARVRTISFATWWRIITLAALIIPISTGFLIQVVQLQRIAVDNLRLSFEAASTMPAELLFAEGLTNLFAGVLIALVFYALSLAFALVAPWLIIVCWVALLILYQVSTVPFSLVDTVWLTLTILFVPLAAVATVNEQPNSPGSKFDFLQYVPFWFAFSVAVAFVTSAGIASFEGEMRMGCVGTSTGGETVSGINLGVTGGTTFYLDAEDEAIRTLPGVQADASITDCDM